MKKIFTIILSISLIFFAKAQTGKISDKLQNQDGWDNKVDIVTIANPIELATKTGACRNYITSNLTSDKRTSTISNAFVNNFGFCSINNNMPKKYYRYKHAGIGLLATGCTLTAAGIFLISIGLPRPVDPYAIDATLPAGIGVLVASVFFTIPGAVLLAEAKKIKRKNIAFYPSFSTTDLAAIKPAAPATGLTFSLKF